MNQTIFNTQETSTIKTDTMLSDPRMELLNNYIDEDSERLSCWMKLGWIERNKSAWNGFISNTQPRFNVILEIFKNQEKRIQELENKINDVDKPSTHDYCADTHHQTGSTTDNSTVCQFEGCESTTKKNGKELMRCPCQTASYCCKEHQKLAYPGHKKECKRLRKET